MSHVHPAAFDSTTTADVSYADPATGEISRSVHHGWIAHHNQDGRDNLLIPCRLHGQIHPALEMGFRACTSYAVTAQEFACVVYAASSPTCSTWRQQTHLSFERWKFSWSRPVQHFLFMAQAMGGPAAFRRRLTATADFTLPPSRGVSRYDCLVRCRLHRQLESVAALYPVTTDDLGLVIGHLGIVLAAPSYTTCEQVSTAYHLLRDDLAGIPHQVEDDTADDHIWPMRAYLYAAKILHRFLSDPIAYVATRSLETLPA